MANHAILTPTKHRGIIVKANNNRFGLVGILAIMVVIASIGALGWLSYDRLSNTSKNNGTDSAQKSEEDKKDEINCGDNRQCFYQAFTDNCSLATIKTTERTVEGDPIITSAKISQVSEGCSVEIVVEGSQDKYGDGKIHAYTCGNLFYEDQRMMANECEDSATTIVSI